MNSTSPSDTIVRVSISLPRELWTAVRSTAALQGMSSAALIVETLRASEEISSTEAVVCARNSETASI